MSKLIALLQFLFALAGVHVGGTDYSTRVATNGQDALYSRAHAQDGVARFECLESSSGRCHYTLYPQTCADAACDASPMRSFDVARGDSRQIAGLTGFRLCVDADGAALDPECKPLAASARR